MRRVVVLLSSAILAIGLIAADGFAASKQKPVAPTRATARAFCTSACKKHYGPSSSVHHVQWYKGSKTPFCWCNN